MSKMNWTLYSLIIQKKKNGNILVNFYTRIENDLRDLTGFGFTKGACCSW